MKQYEVTERKGYPRREPSNHKNFWREKVTRGKVLNRPCSPCTPFHTQLLSFGELPEDLGRPFILPKDPTPALCTFAGDL